MYSFWVFFYLFLKSIFFVNNYNHFLFVLLKLSYFIRRMFTNLKFHNAIVGIDTQLKQEVFIHGRTYARTNSVYFHNIVSFYFCSFIYWSRIYYCCDANALFSKKERNLQKDDKILERFFPY